MSIAPPTPRSQSLNDVRAAIPESCYRRSSLRASWAVARAVVLYAVPMVGLALSNSWWSIGLWWLAAGLAVAGLFVLGHDASHGALFESRRVNQTVSRLCMTPSIHAEAAWDLGHNRIHHGYTTRQGFDFVWHPSTPEEYASFGRFARLRHRLEWSAIGSGAYYLRSVWWDKMWRYTAAGQRKDSIERDKRVLGTGVVVAVAALAVVGALAEGPIGIVWFPAKFVVVPFLLFIQIIGWTVYVHHVDPEIRWWTRREWSQFRGQMESTTILRFPRIINYLWFHNIFVHVPHHVDARIPFHQLPAAARAIDAAFPGTVKTKRYSLASYLRAARACKLYDFDAATWLPYPTASGTTVRS